MHATEPNRTEQPNETTPAAILTYRAAMAHAQCEDVRAERELAAAASASVDAAMVELARLDLLKLTQEQREEVRAALWVEPSHLEAAGGDSAILGRVEAIYGDRGPGLHGGRCGYELRGAVVDDVFEFLAVYGEPVTHERAFELADLATTTSCLDETEERRKALMRLYECLDSVCERDRGEC